MSSILAGLAGVLIALERNAEPYMGVNLIIKGFIGAVIGGTTSIPGAVLGSYLLGVVENFGIWYLPSGYKDAIAFTLLFLFLLFPNLKVKEKQYAFSLSGGEQQMLAIVAHNLKSLMDVADYGYVMVSGEIIAHDTCVKLKDSPIMRKVFVGEFD